MAYIPRTSITVPTPMLNNPFYYDWNPFQPEYAPPEVIGNCTWYAYGRFWEISGATSSSQYRPTLNLGDAKYWYPYTQDGYQRGQTAKLGAIACWDSLTGGGGHVAIVEKIYPDGSYDISNSAYELYYFRMYHIENNYFNPDYSFQGFIYNPYAEGGGNLNLILMNGLKRRRNNVKGKTLFGSTKNVSTGK